MGVDLDEGSRLSRPVLRGGARRAGDGGYPDARDAGAYKREGNPTVRVYDNIPCASAVFDDLAQLEIDAWQIALELEEEGVRKFAGSYDKAVRAIEGKEAALRVA